MCKNSTSATACYSFTICLLRLASPKNERLPVRRKTCGKPKSWRRRCSRPAEKLCQTWTPLKPTKRVLSFGHFVVWFHQFWGWKLKWVIVVFFPRSCRWNSGGVLVQVRCFESQDTLPRRCEVLFGCLDFRAQSCVSWPVGSSNDFRVSESKICFQCIARTENKGVAVHLLKHSWAWKENLWDVLDWYSGWAWKRMKRPKRSMRPAEKKHMDRLMANNAEKIEVWSREGSKRRPLSTQQLLERSC